MKELWKVLLVVLVPFIMFQAWLVREAFNNKTIYAMQGGEIKRLREDVKAMNNNLNQFFFDITTSEIFIKRKNRELRK